MDIGLNRKVLADIAIYEPRTFAVSVVFYLSVYIVSVKVESLGLTREVRTVPSSNLRIITNY